MTGRKKIVVNDRMQKNYIYWPAAPVGKKFHPDFRPQLTPQQMLELGVFGGHYFEGEQDEFPAEWFENAQLSDVHDPSKNYFEIDASQSREEWQRKGWMYDDDPRGWFQWYCRYFMGRRMPEEDARQIRRWKAMRRHVAQLRKNCVHGDFECRPKQRQALLHWAYDSRLI